MMDVVQEKLKPLRAKLDKFPVLHQAEETTKVPKEILVLAGFLLVSLFLVFGVGIASLSGLVGFVYPAFKSFKAIETKTKNDDTQWLVYWVIFAFFSVIESFVDVLLYWIPFYFAFKIAFLLWAMLPQTTGAKFIYEKFLKDFLKKNESHIDAAMAKARKAGESVANDIQQISQDLKKDT